MPRSGWVKPVSDRRLSDLVSVGVLTRVFPPGLVDEVIAVAGRTEQRHRSLPARVMAYFAIRMGLHSEGSYEDVLSQLTDGLSWAAGWAESFTPPSKSAIFQARARLGSKPLEALFVRSPSRSGHHRWLVCGWLAFGWWPSTGAAGAVHTKALTRPRSFRDDLKERGRVKALV